MTDQLQRSLTAHDQVTIPAYGGSSNWASTVTAYKSLPGPLRALVDTLWAVHTYDYDYAATSEDPDQDRDGRNSTTRSPTSVTSAARSAGSRSPATCR